MSNDETLDQLRMDRTSLYREESFTDRRVGTVQRLTPVTADGQDDPERAVVFLGQTQVMTPVGALPLNFELPGDTLDAAMDGFPTAAQAALEQAMEELRDMQQQESSRIVAPGSGGGGQGGMPGGGFQMR